MRRLVVAAAMLLVALAGAAVAPNPAAANHFENSTKTCAQPASGLGAFQCVLTLGPTADDAFEPGEVITIDAAGAFAFVDAAVTGGSCEAVVTGVAPGQVTLTTPAFCPVGATIVVTETLTAEAGAQVCQVLNSTFNDPPQTVCAAGFVAPGPGPATAAECKDGGFAAFGVFKNQGDCVSFVETGGGNPPAGL
ncbi:MAG: hypothetical protein AVDCRST_MAG49-2720 [uncultured Thermomicrobiales bacterium]|uniref:Uncharacterized protein n=1 Tax=uncultured Thermomicrobiales bacterium TaxID=1645740 RepID=A0A6J4V0V6_9BACT|nr:MAG: hypothetical protein AVDCRST_MAG49-2720 [uncultured Thermomicrobiales bacterium]